MKQKQVLIVIGLLVLVGALAFTVRIGTAETNIDATDHWAWSDLSGWWDFYGTDTVSVGTSTLSGYASSSIGEIALNCDTTPGGNICGTSDFKVTNADGGGSLSGCAWNDTVGWIHFWCGDGDCDGSTVEDASSTCASSNFRVTIDANGVFNGYAWNDVEGWVSFNCANSSSCGTSDYKVETSWRPGRIAGYLESSIVDTERAGGATLHSIIWEGSQPSGTSVDFQIAVATSASGPWNYEGPNGSGSAWYGAECPVIGTADPGAGPDKAICVDKNITADNRYLRYKARLQSDLKQSKTPEVEDVVLNWSI